MIAVVNRAVERGVMERTTTSAGLTRLFMHNHPELGLGQFNGGCKAGDTGADYVCGCHDFCLP